MMRLLVCLVALFCAATSAKKLHVDLYVEALCPYCQRMMVGFAPLVEAGLSQEMDFTVYYAGNAKMRGGKLECQHGPSECYLNKVLGCAVDGKDLEEWYPYVECLERAVAVAVGEAAQTRECSVLSIIGGHALRDCAYRHTKFTSLVKTCATETGNDVEALESCAGGAKGEKLQMAAYEAVQALEPPHRWVPWMVVDGMPVFDMAYSLDKILCLHMEPSERPSLCYEPGENTASNTTPDLEIVRT